MKIFISGKKQSGKNTFGYMLGYCINEKLRNKNDVGIYNWDNYKNIIEILEANNGIMPTHILTQCYYNVSFDSFALFLKSMASGLLACPVEMFESEKFKSELSNIKMAQTIAYSKAGVRGIDGFREEIKYLTNREVLIWLGDVVRKDNPYYFAESLIERHEDNSNVLIVTDFRTKDELDVIKNEKDYILIRMENPKERSTETHDTETGLDDYKDWNYIVLKEKNLENLFKRAEVIANDIIIRLMMNQYGE